jgi:hypothetical protein
LPSRYMDITAIGLLANLALAMHLLCEGKPRSVPRLLGMACVAAGMVLITVVFIKRTPGDVAAMQQRYDFSLVQTYYTRNYLSSGNPGYLQHAPLPQRTEASAIPGHAIHTRIAATIANGRRARCVASSWIVRNPFREHPAHGARTLCAVRDHY